VARAILPTAGSFTGSGRLDEKEVESWVGATAGARAGAFEEAARFGELIVLAALGRAVESIVDMAGPAKFHRQNDDRRDQSRLPRNRRFMEF
jgi:hypothetical protein